MNKKPLHPRMGQIRRKGASRGFMTWVIHGDEQHVFWCVCQMLINRNPGGPKDISLDMRTGFGPMYWDPWWSRITANLPTVSSEKSTDCKETGQQPFNEISLQTTILARLFLRNSHAGVINQHPFPWGSNESRRSRSAIFNWIWSWLNWMKQNETIIDNSYNGRAKIY